MIENTKQADPTGSAIAMAIANALNLPKNLTKLTLTFAPDSAPKVECQFITQDGLRAVCEAVSELACFELRPIADMSTKEV